MGFLKPSMKLRSCPGSNVTAFGKAAKAAGSCWSIGVVTVGNGSVDLNTFQLSKKADSRNIQRLEKFQNLFSTQICQSFVSANFNNGLQTAFLDETVHLGHGHGNETEAETASKIFQRRPVAAWKPTALALTSTPMDISTPSKLKEDQRPQLTSDRGPNMSSSSARVLLKSG